MVRRLYEANWLGLDYTEFDAIQSLLVEHPGAYYMSPNMQWLCFLTRDMGLIKMVNDYSRLNEAQVIEYIRGVIEMLRSKGETE